ncbi:GNAT family N-acetyltransferase [Actinacidiphila bryophytorum]|jgi:RimJ/RimL family protein N-acetyltransferase|uniref:GNAT family N-acetyltransferase n=1 Tax=Actinacidiphila bryophytorum TaxID=1436133 RepID=UPI002176E801|nr:GNAT family N-acetyltransferase [Actinacidiphila bryophytorum]UWE08065.1 GNAT family N-acetyltransferase [Actinacidiphila bryophytorum]
MREVDAEVIGTERLTLLPLAVRYAEEMAEVLGDPRLHDFIGGAPHTPQGLRARYERLVAGSGDPAVSWCNWVVRLDAADCLTGTVQATVVGERAEIAWVVGTPWQGKGIATEAARALVAWLGAQGVKAVVAHIHPDHRASSAVAAAAGLTATDEWDDGEMRWRLVIG